MDRGLTLWSLVNSKNRKIKVKLGRNTYSHNSSYSEGVNQEDCSLRPAKI
jgi:hypothetical protein